ATSIDRRPGPYSGLTVHGSAANRARATRCAATGRSFTAIGAPCGAKSGVRSPVRVPPLPLRPGIARPTRRRAAHREKGRAGPAGEGGGGGGAGEKDRPPPPPAAARAGARAGARDPAPPDRAPPQRPPPPPPGAPAPPAEGRGRGGVEPAGELPGGPPHRLR